jgi:UDP-3-O-[3-hydroxymyristoyl] glucosamine N-acyltransferase
MEFTAKQIAQYVGGRVVGNENTTVSDFAKIEEGRKGQFLFFLILSILTLFMKQNQV